MSEFTTIAIRRSTADRFKALAKSHRLRQYELAERLVDRVEQLPAHAQERLLGLRASRATARTSNTRRRGAKDAA